MLWHTVEQRQSTRAGDNLGLDGVNYCVPDGVSALSVNGPDRTAAWRLAEEPGPGKGHVQGIPGWAPYLKPCLVSVDSGLWTPAALTVDSWAATSWPNTRRHLLLPHWHSGLFLCSACDTRPHVGIHLKPLLTRWTIQLESFNCSVFAAHTLAWRKQTWGCSNTAFMELLPRSLNYEPFNFEPTQRAVFLFIK